MMSKYHYIERCGISTSWRSGVNVGLFFGGVDIGGGIRFGAEVVGACVFTGFPVPELGVGLFGLQRDDQGGLWELSRLVLVPAHQEQEHNLASWFVARSIKLLRAKESVRCVLSYADSDYHSGTVYQACGFGYYGLTAPKADFVFDSGKKHQRGTVKTGGKWVDRSRKHRFLKVFDDSLVPLWEQENYRRKEDDRIPEHLVGSA